MTDEREAILARVHQALAPLPRRAVLPEYDSEIAVLRQLLAGRDLVELFTERITRVNGLAFTEVGALVAHLRANGWLHGYCDPVLWPRFAPHLGADFKVATAFDRKRVDDYAFGLTRAAGAIAEAFGEQTCRCLKQRHRCAQRRAHQTDLGQCQTKALRQHRQQHIAHVR